MAKDITGSIIKMREEMKRRKELDKTMDKLLNINDEWFFETDDHDCEECKSTTTSHKLNFYLGTYNGEEAQKYECTNIECGFVEIKTIEELMNKIK